MLRGAGRAANGRATKASARTACRAASARAALTPRRATTAAARAADRHQNQQRHRAGLEPQPPS